jgi:diguanylate cyclase (GGDEF)-like protein
LEAATKWGDITHTEQLFTMDECWALRRGGVHIGKPGPYGLLCKHLSPGSSSDYMCVPLIAQGEILGLFYLQSTDHISSIDLDLNKQLAVTVAKQISMALANLNLRESLHIQAIVDPLTGLFNRRYMEETLEREIYRIRRRHSHIGVIMSDIDHFKRINDIYGHDAGDMVLTAIAGLFKKNIRREDIPCRYGGEEFLMILPDATQEDAYQRAEDLCRLVSELEIKHLGLSLGKITASFGVASCPAHGEKVADLIHAADSALYLAKERGRNQVVSAGRDNITEPTPDTDW